MKVVNDFVQGKMNKEISGRIIPKGIYRDLLNGRVTSSDNSDTGIIESIKGTNKITIPVIPVGFEVIGMTIYKEKLYYIATNSTLTTIGEFDLDTSINRYLFENSDLFNFNKTIFISNIEVFEGMLFFCDYNNDDPYKVNIERAIAGLYTNRDSILLVKAPPILPPNITFIDESETHTNNNFKEASFQFAYRFHYLDGEISAISQRSQVAFKSLFGQVASATAGVIDMVKTSSGFQLRLKIDDDTPIIYDLNSTPPGPHGIDLGTQFFGFDYILTETDYIGVIFRKTLNNIMEVLDFTLGGISNWREIAINGSNPQVVICPQNTSSYFVSYEYNYYLYVYNDRLIRVSVIGAHSGIMSNTPVAMSGNGKYVYIAFNDELEVSTNYGAENTFVRTLHVDENSTPGGDDIYNQGEVVSVCCSQSGRNVYAVVANQDGHTDYKVVRSYDYGSTWTVSDNVNVGVVNFNSMKIVTDITGAKVTVGYALDIKLVFKTSTDGGITFPISNDFIKDIAQSENSLFINMSLDGGSLYIGYLDTILNGYTAKSVNDGATFFTLLTTTQDVVPGTYAMKSDVIEETNYKNDFIQNDIACVNIDTTRAAPTPDVKYIEVIAFDVNSGQALSIVKDIPDKIPTVTFCNDTTYKLIPEKDINKLYDNVPHKVRSFAITQNSLIFGGYTDGYNSEITLNIRIIDQYTVLSAATGHSLKHGVRQSYAIIYYDDFNRSSDAIPIGEININTLRENISNVKAYVQLQISGAPPLWATSYAIAKKPALLDYEIISAFDAAYLYNNKVYLETTSYDDIDFQEGSKIELVLQTADPSGYEIATTPLELKITHVVTINENKVAGDGTTIVLPNGIYVVASSTDLEDYDKIAITAKTSRYTSSIFYIHEPRSVKAEKVYFELPYRFNIIDGIHQGDSIVAGDTIISLLDDFDVVMAEEFPVEIYKLSKHNIVNNLGRPNLDSENFDQIDRYAGLCASEVYVQDTNFNGFSSFNLWMINYKDLDRRNGDIKLIDSEDTNIEVYQEDRVSKVMYKKNILSMADGKQALSQTQDIWGEQQKYNSEYGLTNPESFSKWGDSSYYVDAKRGVVIKKQNNMISPISYLGMNDYFHDLLTKNIDNKILGYFEPEFGTYHVVTTFEDLAYSEKSKGWEFRSNLIPDFVYNDDSDIYSFKDLSLYKHNIGDPNDFYGVKFKVRVISYINDSPNLVKIYNTIQIIGFKPETVSLISDENRATINENLFEEKEKGFFSYIPMDTFLTQKTIVAGVCLQDVTLAPFIPLNNLNKDIHVNDDVYIYNPIDQSYTQIGILEEINDNGITLYNNTTVAQEDIIITISDNDVNGNNLRSRHVKLVIEFPVDEAIRFESYLVDIDISKQ